MELLYYNLIIIILGVGENEKKKGTIADEMERRLESQLDLFVLLSE
jgi:hypothetical protein